jgi:signal transduction histidine kinase
MITSLIQPWGDAGDTVAKSFCKGACVRASRFSADRVRKLPLCLLALVAVCFLVQPATAAQVKEVRRVLFLNALGASNSFITRVESEIRAALQKSPYQVEIYTEYLEAVLFPDAASQQEIREGYIRKYRDRQPDLIIAIGSDALKFMVESHARFFPGIPIVFCEGVKELAEYPKLDSNFAGVWIALQFAKTLDAALKLQPGTKHVAVVGGSGRADRIFEAMARKELRSYEDRLEFTYLTDLEMPALLQRLKRLPNGTVILYVTFSQDAAGTRFMDATQSLPMVIAAANAPVFALTEVFVGQGTVGGYVNSETAQGQAAAGITMRMLGGERPQAIPVVQSTNVYMFDWRALRRWGFRASDLPPGSIVLYRQPSVWEQYKWWISGALGLLALESLLIAVLLSNLRLRRRLEKSLKRLAGQLLHTQDEERRRMARDLHDGTAQDLNAISLCLSQVLEDGVLDQNGTRHLLEEAHSVSRKALQEVRSVSYALHPPILEEAGLVPALRWYLDGLMKRTSLRIVFDAPAGMGPLPPEVESTLFRIVQESISNILRHSGADTVEVRLEHDSKSVRMNIKDNGRGMGAEALTSVNGGAPLGVGIAGMRERVRQFHGRLEIRSGRGGTTVLVSVPVSREQTNHPQPQSHRATEKQEMETARDKQKTPMTSPTRDDMSFRQA